MFKIYYENHLGEKLDFTQWPYMVTGGNVFDNKYEIIKEDDHILDFDRGITEKKISIDIRKGPGVSLEHAIDRLEDIFEKDVVALQPGKLYVGNSYLKCWIAGTTKSRWVNDVDSISNELIVVSDYSFWIIEEKHSFIKQSIITGEGDASPWLEYPFDYPYEYAKVMNLQYLQNDHYTDSGFRMVIYGPCINPLIRIAGHIYELQATLYDGEYAVIDSSTRYAKDRTIMKVKLDGTKEDLFNSRNMDNDIWQKIPPGRNIVSWNGSFGFEIFLFNERGGPKWIL